MDEQVFVAFRDLIYRESGITLRNDKKQLLTARIQRRLRELGLSDPKGYLEVIESDLTGHELVKLLDAVSTNVTYFFREPAHFDFLRMHLERRKASGARRLRIWCAASSSGQEPFTISMVVHQTFAGARIDARILATDICTKVLTKAVNGVYTDEEVQKVPDPLRRRYFEDTGEPEERWLVRDELKALVTFGKLNLVHIPYPMKGPFDIIFCRNVMIYFDIEVRRRVVAEFARLTAPGGLLVLSHSESLMGIDQPFRRIENSIYERVS